MKRFVTILALLLIVTTLAACAADTPTSNATTGSTAAPTDSSPAGTTNSTSESTVSTETATTMAPTESSENLATIEVTLPAFMFEDEDMDNFDAEAYASEMEFFSADINEDGSVTIALTEDRYQDLLADAVAQCDIALSELVDGTSYITEITRNDDFSVVTISVVRAGYENAFDITHVSVGFIAAIYQGTLGNNPSVEIQINDADTGATIFSCVFPDVLGES